MPRGTCQHKQSTYYVWGFWAKLKGGPVIARLKPDKKTRGRRSAARTPEAREQELASFAYDLAEEQIESGTVSSQVLTHFLRMGSTRERLEQQRIAYENELLRVKREAIESQRRVEELYMQALDAMRSYAGASETAESDEE